MKRNILILLVLVFIGGKAFSQRKSLKDSVYRIPIVGLHLSGQLPGGDLANRFGPSLNVGLPVYYKTAKNIVFGIEANYFFGSTIREKIMSNLYNVDGTITDANGNPGAIRLNERGWNIYGMVGGVINALGHNKNSGLMLMAGLGYMQHKVKIIDVGKSLPQIHGDLAKGYDRLTGGMALTEYIGYMFMSQNRIANFYVGFEFQQAFTKGLRTYQYDLMASDSQPRLDLLYGFRFGWLLPLYKKTPKDFYYY